MANPNITNLRPDVADAMAKLRKDFTQRTGYATTIPYDGGFRSTSDQARIYADSLKQGFRAAPTGQSAHEYGAAFDLNIVGQTTGDAARDKANPLYETLARLGQAYGLKPGFYFKSGKPDPYHFESNESLESQRAKWAAIQAGKTTGNEPAGTASIAAVSALAVAALLALYFMRK